MFEDFFVRALLAGIGIALVTSPLGCFIIWRKLYFFGDSLANSALLGVTIGFFFDINIAFSVFLISSAVALLLLQLHIFQFGHLVNINFCCNTTAVPRLLRLFSMCFCNAPAPLLSDYNLIILARRSATVLAAQTKTEEHPRTITRRTRTTL